MKVDGLLHVLSRLQSHVVAEIPQEIVTALGSTVVVTPDAIDVQSKLPTPYYLLGDNDTVSLEITGAIVTGDNFSAQLSKVVTQSSWFPRALLVILSDKPDVNVFKDLWEKRVGNAVYYTPYLYVFNPFDGRMSLVNASTFQEFLKGRWMDMKGASVPVTMFHYPLAFKEDYDGNLSLGIGIDASALYEFSKYTNMTPRIEIVQSNDTYDAFTNSINQVLSGQTDFTMMSQFLGWDTGMEYTPVIWDDNYSFLRKRGMEIRGWDILTRIFRWEVWLAMISSIIVTTRFVMWMLTSDNYIKAFTLVTQSMYGLTVTNRRVPKNLRTRLIIGAVMVCGASLVPAFQASLFKFVNSRFTYEYPRTLADVYRKDVKIITVRRDLKFFPEHVREMKDKFVYVRFGVRNWTINHNEVLLYLRKRSELLIKQIPKYENLIILDEVLDKFKMSYATKRGSPFFEILCDFSTRAFEGGLFDYWLMLTMSMIHRGNFNTKRKRATVLKMRDVEVAFFALYGGLGVSFCCFVLELITPKRLPL